MFGTFISTGTPGGGQEITALQSLSVAVHQGMVYVPIGYQTGEITNLDEVHGGSPWVLIPPLSLRIFLIPPPSENASPHSLHSIPRSRISCLPLLHFV